MKKKLNLLIAGTVILGVVLSLLSVALISQAKPEPMTRKIVVFKSGILNEPAREALVKKFGGVKIKDLSLIDGKAVLLPERAAAKLDRQPGVLRIDDDVEVFALGKPQPAQVLPWGVDRIDAEKVWGITTGDPIKVAILDTGIDVKHPDLKDNIKGGVNTINPRKSYNDDNGHGTHVAGIVAAINNEIGVVGVSPKIDLYAVKVLNAAGSGYLSDVIEGLEWAIANGMQVVNMSFGTSVYNASFEEAIKKVYNAGIVQVAAAGNNGPADDTVLYPAKFTQVIAVSATDENDNLASWSSRGPEIDLAAPGVNIYSTYKGSSYKTLSGTSMAAPHVAGTIALILDTPVGSYDINGNGKWDPDEVKTKLCQKSIDLGDFGVDNLYGCGLVNAYYAVSE